MAMALLSKKSILIRDVYIPERILSEFTKIGPSVYEKIYTAEFEYGKIYIRCFIYPSVEKQNNYIKSDIQAVFEAVEFNPIAILETLNAKQTEIKILGGE